MTDEVTSLTPFALGRQAHSPHPTMAGPRSDHRHCSHRRRRINAGERPRREARRISCIRCRHRAAGTQALPAGLGRNVVQESDGPHGGCDGFVQPGRDRAADESAHHSERSVTAREGDDVQASRSHPSLAMSGESCDACLDGVVEAFQRCRQILGRVAHQVGVPLEGQRPSLLRMLAAKARDQESRGRDGLHRILSLQHARQGGLKAPHRADPSGHEPRVPRGKRW